MPDILPVAERRIHDNPAVILHRLPFHEVATLNPDTVKIIPQIPDQPAVNLHRITHGPGAVSRIARSMAPVPAEGSRM